LIALIVDDPQVPLGIARPRHVPDGLGHAGKRTPAVQPAACHRHRSQSPALRRRNEVHHNLMGTPIDGIGIELDSTRFAVVSQNLAHNNGRRGIQS
jgi:hypothetical protein